MSNVIKFEEAKKIEDDVDARIERERYAAVHAFNLAYSRYLLSKGKFHAPPPKRLGEGRAYEAYLDKACKEHPRALSS